MFRAFIPLWIGTVCSVAVGAQVTAVDPATAAAIAPSVVNCETPTDLTGAPASNSEAALLAKMEAWWEQKEALSQMEVWWRERTEQRAATASTTAPPPTASEAIAQMEAWWRQQGELRNAMRKPVLPAQHRRDKGYADHQTEFVGPNDRRVSGPTRSMLRDDELSAIRGMPQR